MSTESESYTFQIIDWYSENYDKRDNDESEDTYGGYKDYNDDVGSDDEGDNYEDESGRMVRFDEETGQEIAQEEMSAQYVIYVTGRDVNGKTYSVEIREFTPYFYVRAPDHVTTKNIPLFERWVRESMNFKQREGLLRVTLHEKKSFRNFDNHKFYKFFRLVFNNTKAMQNAVSLFQQRIASNTDDSYKKLYPKRNLVVPGITGPRGFQFDLHENMIDPLLKFIHHKSVKPVGWIRLPKKKVSERESMPTQCDYNLSIYWNDIEVLDIDRNAPFKVMAYDIECDSAHGDFPVPIKDYTKLGREIYMTYIRMEKKYSELKQAVRTLDRNIQGTIQYNEEKKSKKQIISRNKDDLVENIEESKQELEEYKYNCDLLEQLLGSKKEYAWACIQTAFGLVPTDLEESEECEIDIGKYEWMQLYKTYFDDISRVFPKNSKAHPEMTVSKRVAGVIEKKLVVPTDEKSIDRKNAQTKAIQHIIESLNKNFPPLEGDHTIQIGLSFIEYGKSTPYKNYMITVGTCTPLHNAETIVCETEKQLLLKFREVMLKEDPDIITGYNIDGFDTAWLFKRAKECGIEQKFARLSRFNDYVSILKERQVKSATGELVRREYVDLPGRIQLDIMPQVQKGYNLESYKLDDVSAEFMNGKVDSVEYDEKSGQSTIYTNAVKGLHERNYVLFNEIDGYLEKKYKDGQKFEVQKMGTTDGKKWFRVNGEIRLNMARKCMWCLGKDDTSPSDIFRLQKGTAEDRYIIAKYCMMDVILCIELLNKLELLNNNIGMANVCMNPLSWIINRGQGVKILSLVAFFIRKRDYLLPCLYKDLFDRESYEGAVVLDPMPNIYLDDPISVLDYGSLYPSSMIEGNLSHETIIDPKNSPQYLGDEGKELLDKLGYDVEDITYDTFAYVNNAKVKSGVKTVRYVQYRDGTKGIIPQILQYLIKNRKDTRNKIAYQTVSMSDGKVLAGMYDEKKRTIRSDKETYKIPEGVDVVATEETYNEFQQKVLDGLQLAFKITANSLYGQVGAKTSDIYYKEIAASTTAIGRARLIQAQVYSENPNNYPQTLKDGRTIYLQNKVVYGDSCTGDTPIMLNIGGEIKLQTIDNFDESLWTAYREFKSDQPNLTDKMQVNLEQQDIKIWTHKGWAKVRRVIRHHTDKKIYRVLTHTGCVDVTEDHSLLDLNANQIKPKDCKIGTELLHGFPIALVGMYKYSSTRNNIYNIDIYRTASKVDAQIYYYHQRNLGFHVNISIEDDCYVLRRMKYDDVCNLYDLHKIKSISVLHESYNDYVYDIETEAGVFHAGIGSMIIKNTDSVFVRFQCLDDEGNPLKGREARARSIKLAIDTEHAIQEKILRAPQVLEYEKTFHPFILFSKKRYIGDLYEFDPDKFSRKSMGIVLKRRDNAPIVKVVYGKIIDIIMKEQNIAKAVRTFQYELKELAAQRVDVDTLIITKTLSSFYKDPDRIAHKVLADRMAERDPGNKPLTGDRIPFIYIQKKGKNILQGDRIEHPDYYKQQMMNPEITKDAMKIDAEFYVMNQIRKPVTQIFALCIDKLPGFKGDMKVYEKKYRELVDTGKYTLNECLKRTNELKRKDAEKLLMAEVLRILDNQRNKTNPIDFYFKKMTTTKKTEEVAEE